MDVVDVGDQATVTLTAPTGRTVAVRLIDPAGRTVSQAPVPEAPAGSGRYPYTFPAGVDGVWMLLFSWDGQVEPLHVRARPVGPPPYAVPDDVVEVFRPLSAEERVLTAALLRHASRMLRNRIPDLDTRILAGGLDREQATLAVVQMTVRVLRNPQGLKIEAVGPFTRTFDTATALGQLAITKAEIALVAARRRRRARAGTITTQPGLAPAPECHVRRRRG